MSTAMAHARVDPAALFSHVARALSNVTNTTTASTGFFTDVIFPYTFLGGVLVLMAFAPELGTWLHGGLGGFGGWSLLST
jgi:hypothetical protein